MKTISKLVLALGGIALIGAGCFGGGVSQKRSIVSSDPKADVNSHSMYAQVESVRGTKTLVRPSDIIDNGLARDEFEKITEPVFVSVEEALAEEAFYNQIVGISVLREGIPTFYSSQVLAWHEILEDTIDGKRVIFTSSALTDTSNAYVVDETFGTSGYVWNSNPLLYDESTDSLWLQATGQAVYGDRAGEQLEVFDHDIMAWGSWQAAYPEGQVLSTNTGFNRGYDRNPYGTYPERVRLNYPQTVPAPTILHPKTTVYGVRIGNEAKAYEDLLFVQASRGRVKNENLDNTSYVIWIDGDGIYRAALTNGVQFDTVVQTGLVDASGDEWTLNANGTLTLGDNTLEPLPLQRSYWFLWYGMNEDTQVYGDVYGLGLTDGAFEPFSNEPASGKEEIEPQSIFVGGDESERANIKFQDPVTGEIK